MAKAALVEIQQDEYGGGRPERVHQTIYRQAMEGLGLDPEYGAYADQASAITFASTNLMSLFGLHRRLCGAIVGHLAAYEMTSSLPCRMVSSGFRRAGYDERVTGYFAEHVEADAVHEQFAGRDLAGGLVEAVLRRHAQSDRVSNGGVAGPRQARLVSTSSTRLTFWSRRARPA